MPRQNREAPGCYVPSGGLSHCEIVPISDTYCCPKSCRLGAGRIRFAENRGARATALSIHVEHMSSPLEHEDYRRRKYPPTPPRLARLQKS